MLKTARICLFTVCVLPLCLSHSATAKGTMSDGIDNCLPWRLRLPL